MTDLLDTIKNQLEGLLSDVPPAEVREMTKAEFLDYLQAEIKLAKEESPEDRKPRVEHLLANIEFVQKMGGFEDKGAKSIPVYSGKLSVQAQTAWRERQDRTVGASAAMGNQAPGPGGSFTSKSNKPLTGADLMAALQSLLDGEPAEDGDADGVKKDESEAAAESDDSTGADESGEEGNSDESDTEDENSASGSEEESGDSGDDAGDGDGDEDDDPEADIEKAKDVWAKVESAEPVDGDDDYDVAGLRVF